MVAPRAAAALAFLLAALPPPVAAEARCGSTTDAKKIVQRLTDVLALQHSELQQGTTAAAGGGGFLGLPPSETDKLLATGGPAKQLAKRRRKGRGQPVGVIVSSDTDSQLRVATALKHAAFDSAANTAESEDGATDGVLHVEGVAYPGSSAADDLRDALRKQLAACPTSLVVFHDAGGALSAQAVEAAVAPLAKDSTAIGPPLLVLLVTGDNQWAKSLLPSATVLGQVETAEEKLAREAAAAARRLKAEEEAAARAAQADAEQRERLRKQEEADEAQRKLKEAQEQARKAAMCGEIRSFDSARQANASALAAQLQRLGASSRGGGGGGSGRQRQTPYSFAELDSLGGYIGQKWAISQIEPLIENRMQVMRA